MLASSPVKPYFWVTQPIGQTELVLLQASMLSYTEAPTTSRITIDAALAQYDVHHG